MQCARDPLTAYAGTAIILCVLPAAWLTQQDWIGVLLCTLILVFGLPHGAYDIFLLRAHVGRRWVLRAAVWYALAALAVVAIWWLSPAAFLLFFLALSAIHFGDSDWPQASRREKLCWGTLVLAVPACIQPAEVGALLATLAPASVVTLCLQGLSWLLLPAALGLLIESSGLIRKSLVLVMLGLMCLQSSALVGFAVYFCLFHARTHLQRWRRCLPVEDTKLANILVMGVLGVVGIAIIPYALSEPQQTIDSSAVTVTFLTLASLTVPHMVTVAIANHVCLEFSDRSPRAQKHKRYKRLSKAPKDVRNE